MDSGMISGIICLVLLVLCCLSSYYISTKVKDFFKNPLGSMVKALFGETILGDCPKDYTNVGLFCFRPVSTVKNPLSTLADCPSGYTHMGLYCYRGPSTYRRKIREKCRAGYTNNGLFCGRGAHSPGQGSMKCPAGKKLTGGRCYTPCPPGHTNNGLFCGRGAHTLPMSAMTCKEGYEKTGKVGRCKKKKEPWQFWM